MRCTRRPSRGRAVPGLTVPVSIALQGVTVTPARRMLDERRRVQGVLPLGRG